MGHQRGVILGRKDSIGVEEYKVMMRGALSYDPFLIHVLKIFIIMILCYRG